MGIDSRRAARAPRKAPASVGLVLFLGLRILRENHVSLALLLVAIAVGVGFQVPNVANLAGYREELVRQEVSLGQGHVRIRPPEGEERLEDVSPILAQVRRMPGVQEALPVLALPGAVSKGARLSLQSVTGIDLAGKHRPYRLVAGQDLDPADQGSALLGERLARKLKVKVGDEVELQILLSVQPRLVLDDEGIGRYPIKVRGLVGGAAMDQVFVARPFLTGELGEDAATVVVVYLPDGRIDEARRAAATIGAALPQTTVRAWIDDSRYIRSNVSAIGALEKIANSMSLVAVGVPVLALFYIDALHRGRQVSLLSAMGFRSREVFLIFVAKAVIVGFIGVVIGGLVGYALLFYFRANPIFAWDKFVVRPALALENVLRPMGLVWLTTILAGSYPAWRAARVDPSAMLRRIE